MDKETVAALRGRCVVLVPVAKTLEPETEKGLNDLAARGYPVRFLKGGSQVDLVRSAMASRAVLDGFEETMWIDSDVAFQADDVDKLRSHNRPLIAGVYVKKDRDEFAARFPCGQLTFGTGGSVVPAAEVGMGFTLVKRVVYEGIARVHGLPACGGGYDPSFPITPYFIPMIEDGTYLSEDYSFCRRARAAGFAVTVDTTIRLGHVHRHVRTWDDLLPRHVYESLQINFT